jgi:hypothetical protein
MAYDGARGLMIVLDSYNGQSWAYVAYDLTMSANLVSVGKGGNVEFEIDAGASHAGKGYFVLGCMDSPAPRGILLGGVTLLLNPDPYFWLTALHPNTLIANSLGLLDDAGRATATSHVPPLPSALIGWLFYHAYVVFQSRIDYASTPVPLTLVP